MKADKPLPPTLLLASLAVILIFLSLMPPTLLSLPLSPPSQSPLSLLLSSPGANVYISCNRLLRGAPEFILQPVVMARFLDKSWQPLVVDS